MEFWSRVNDRKAELAAEGLAETEAGLELGQAAREMAVEGVGEVAEGAAELGAADEAE